MQTLRKFFITGKLLNITGVAWLTAIVALFIAAGVAYEGMLFGILFLVVLIGLPCIYAIVVYPEFGMIILFIAANFLFYIARLGVPGPLGTALDGLQALLILGMLIKQRNERNWAILKSPISTVLLIWIGYNLLEAGNPVAESRLAWVYTVRSVAIIALTYFVFMYQIRTVKYIRLIIKIWLCISTFAALYAFKQEYFGFSAAEEAYLNSKVILRELLFIGGHWRKFSIYSDPVAYSYNAVISSILCISLITGNIARWKKILLGFLTLFFLNCMLYSGTRGANILLPVAMFLFAVMKFNRYILAAAIAFALALMVLIFIPTGNPTIVRFQSTFKPNNDASYLVRKGNQKRIQPYILTHPMGGGLGATGVWGQRFAPGSFLANFPPDSGYIRVAVELGWLGLIAFCTLMFVTLKTGINNYYQIKDPELKSYCLAAVLMVFAYNVGNFPQEAIVQYPSNVIFYLLLALINITYRLDRERLAGANVHSTKTASFPASSL
ncbi:O-antigen ligase family protein [Mucilaginibacter sp.]